MTNWAQLSVRIPEELFVQIKLQAEKEDRPLVTVVKRALTAYLEAQRGGQS